jgi:hypothetical protein
MDERQAISLAFTAVFLPTVLLGSAVFMRRRNQFPIRGRNPWLVLLFNLCVCAIVAVTGVHSVLVGTPSDIPCFGFFLILCLCTSMACLALTARAWSLLFVFEITKDVIAVEAQMNAMKKQRPPPPGDELLSHRNSVFSHSQSRSGGLDPSEAEDYYAYTTASSPGQIKYQSPLAQWKQSWYTRHRWLAQPPFLRRTALFLCFLWAMFFAGTISAGDIPNACGPNTRLFITLCMMLGGGICLLVSPVILHCNCALISPTPTSRSLVLISCCLSALGS